MEPSSWTKNIIFSAIQNNWPHSKYRAACADMDRPDLLKIYELPGAAELLELQLSNTRSDPRGILMLSIRKHLHDLG